MAAGGGGGADLRRADRDLHGAGAQAPAPWRDVWDDQAMIIRTIDRASLIGMAIGVALMLQPWWPGGFAAGFFVTVSSTVAQIVFSHLYHGFPTRADGAARVEDP